MTILANGSNFELWNYRVSPNQGYTILRDQYVDPLGNSNLADKILADENAYNGVSELVNLAPNTTYYISVWAFIPYSYQGQLALQINNPTAGNFYYDPNNVGSYSLTAIYVNPLAEVDHSPPPWTRYVWQFTTPSSFDISIPSTFYILIAGSPTGFPQLDQMVLYGAWIDITNSDYVEPSSLTYSLPVIDTEPTVSLPSIDLKDLGGSLITTPFDSARLVYHNYNLIPYPDEFEYGKGQWVLPQPTLYHFFNNAYLSPSGSSNFADLVTSDIGAYAGIQHSFIADRAGSYSIGFYAFAIYPNSVFTMKLWNTNLGNQYWGGLLNSIGFYNSGAYETVPLSDLGSRPYQLYQWTFDVPASGSYELTIKIEQNCQIVFYGLQVVDGTVLYPFIEPTVQYFTSDSTSLLVNTQVIGYPDVNLLDLSNTPIYPLFDITRFSISDLLGKAVIPYGNEFNKLVNSNFIYTTDPRAEIVIYGNRELEPSDTSNLSLGGINYYADLFEGSINSNVLSIASGIQFHYGIDYDFNTAINYVIAIWIKPRFLSTAIQLSLYPIGDWFTGFQALNSESNYADSSWQFINGTLSIDGSNLSGSSNTCRDLGKPYYIPDNMVLSQVKATKVTAIPSISMSTFLAYETTTSTVYDLSTENTGNTLLESLKTAVVAYQTFDVSSLASPSIGVYLWHRIASEYQLVINNITSWYSDPTVQGNLIGVAVIFTTIDNRKITKVFRNYNKSMQEFLENKTFISLVSDSNLIENSNSNPITINNNLPVGVGIIISGKLSTYGGPRIFDNASVSSNWTICDVNQWTRVSLSFTPSIGMYNRTTSIFKPGTDTPFSLVQGNVNFSFNAAQPNQPMIGNSPDPSYSPWSPYWTSFYAYGLMAYESTGGALSSYLYFRDDIDLDLMIMPYINNTIKTAYPTLQHLNTITITPSAIQPLERDVHSYSHVGINCTGNSWYASNRIFLNLMKMSSGGRYRETTDYRNVWPQTPQQGWFLFRDSASPNGNGIDNIFNCLNTRVWLTGVTFLNNVTTITVPSSGGNWSDLSTGVYDGTVIGTNIAPNTKFVSYSIDPYTSDVYIEIDTPTIGASDPLSWYGIKREIIDNLLDLNVDSNGYIQYLPSHYTLFSLGYRLSAPWNYTMGQMNHPYMPSGRYVLKWDGDGYVHMNNTVTLSAGPYPVTEISRSSNRLILDIDCSGNTATGQKVNIKYALGSDVPTPNWTQAQAGFLVAITATNPTNHVRNIVLVEEQYESLLDSGEYFYPEYLDRLKYYKCIRFLDWCQGNVFHSIAANSDIANLTQIDDVAWVDGNVPLLVIINLCNTLNKDCWINIPPSVNDTYYEHIATVFKDNLNPSLRLYVEFGNEQWNGGLGTSLYIAKYNEKFNIQGDPSAPNISWDAHMQTYAKLSQNAFDVFDSVFSGSKGRLEPPRLYDNPKQQHRRFLRCLSSISNGSGTAQQIYKYGQLFTKNISGIPYDVIASNMYFADMLDAATKLAEQIVAPAYYPWTLTDVISKAWVDLPIRQDQESHFYNNVQNGVTSDYPSTMFGLDLDGDVLSPVFCFYEGGAGSPGPSPYAFKRICQLCFGEDDLDTMFNLYKTVFEWWENLANNSNNPDASTFNLWETSMSYSSSDQWGVTEKAFMPEYQYHEYPRVRAIDQHVGLNTMPTLAFSPSTRRNMIVVTILY